MCFYLCAHCRIALNIIIFPLKNIKILKFRQKNLCWLPRCVRLSHHVHYASLQLSLSLFISTKTAVTACTIAYAAASWVKTVVRKEVAIVWQTATNFQHRRYGCSQFYFCSSIPQNVGFPAPTCILEENFWTIMKFSAGLKFWSREG